MPKAELAAQVFLQLAVVLAACRLVGWGARRIGQPEVVGQMIAGILLGPSLLGAVAPAAQAALFPPATAGALHVLSQVGLCLYMFLVGAGFRVHAAPPLWRGATTVAGAGTALPFLLGALLALPLAARGAYFGSGVPPAVAALFLGSAMAITAFPVLARIIEERGLAGTPLGTMALAAASVSDAAAWLGLAFVLALAAGTPLASLGTLAAAGVYALVVLLVVRPLMRYLDGAVGRAGRLDDALVSPVLVVLFLGALAAERIGIHAVLGSFLIGLAVPPGALATYLTAAFERPVRTLLLPLFFVSSGLSTSVGLLGTGEGLLVLAVVLAAATFGKVAGGAFGARLAGQSWRDALGTGALLNARGLMELLALNVGLERGLIEPRLFAVMVLMAIATTLLAAPLFHLTRLAAWRPQAARSLPESRA